MAMKMRFFDFEVTPNWWMCEFGDLPEDLSTLNESIKDTFVTVTSDMDNCRDLLLSLLREEGYVQVGYNVKGYDLVIANGIYQGFTPQQIKIINDIIINPSCAYTTKEHLRMMPFAKKKIKGVVYQDLMDDGSGSLKEKEATLGLNILESSVDFNTENLTKEQKDEMIYYCKQDVYASMVFYAKVVHPYTLTKLAMGKHFNIPEDTCHMSTNARLVAIALGAKRQSFPDAEKVEIFLPDKIKDYCYENLPSKIIDAIRTSTTGLSVDLFGNKVEFGNGGIHSVLSTDIYVESNDEWLLMNVDAASYYPSILIQLDCLSRAVTNKQVFVDIFNERIELKHKKNKTYDDEMAQLADKLVLNTTFGASGNKWLDLYDPYQCTRTCRIGQIFLGALANKLYKVVPELQVIQTNTDGILIYVKRKYVSTVKRLMQEWSDISGINMEEDEIDKIWQLNVNNYLMVKKGGSVKRKGGWLNDDFYRPGYVTTASLNAVVCAKAAQSFLLHGEDIVTNIFNNRKLHDFTISCTKGPTFGGVIQRFSDGHEEQLFKANRVIASKDTSLGKIYKYKNYKGERRYYQMPSIPDNCRTVNKDLADYNFDDVRKDLDYMYYIKRTADLLNVPWRKVCGSSLIRINDFDLDLE